MFDYEPSLAARMEWVTIEEFPAGGTPELTLVRREGVAEGYTFVERAAIEWLSGANRFDGHGEGFFVAQTGGPIVGICGLNCDPYSDDETVGRLRHLYVIPRFRGRGVGRLLVESCLELAQARFDRVRLRTFEADAARLYEAMGFQPVDESDSTHCFFFHPV
jgi:GNAT superfamily N-acetyltransferase